MKNNNQIFLETHYVKKLELGKHYITTFHRNKPIIVKFIKVTKCGYNFLDLNTDICILKRLIYPIKNGCGFYLNNNFRIL